MTVIEMRPAPAPASPPPDYTKTPYTIAVMMDQLGRRLNGAFAYIGAHQITYRYPLGAPRDREYRSGFKSHEEPMIGGINYDVGLSFAVNGRRGQGWRMLVVYEPDDTYSVWLCRRAKPTEKREGKHIVVMDHHADVYGDELKHAVESMYDKAIKEHNGGWINL
jgi:hypothetical protein